MEIARALGLNYVFLCEFEELRSPLRDARSQASRRRAPAGTQTPVCVLHRCGACHACRRHDGCRPSPAATHCPTVALQGGGVHGNAILSKFDFADVAVVPHRRAGPYGWLGLP